ncbi:hypothetical protein AB595_16210 [Massilia sp. WF1]|uniref:pilus assembly protein TadG-related protein n=1 Tax=unclassified Massilia TaxID=2609279 RepID=UPI00064A8E3D|nr:MULTISPECIES: pilus assembly protein TadG-related protein [unclassified Massilia]ALK97854.1 hypothetical protein AM586_18230 [Massilia sp. WG5]KLU35800.1 hypothetical protein AB595_16210 [Massilia sp. WF1]
MAIIVAVTLAVLVGFAGIVLDLGRLFVNKTELQNAADACALAAASELVCNPAAGPCPAAFLADAQAAGIAVASRNASDFRSAAVTIAPADVRFNTAIGPNDAYLSLAAGASPNSRFAMCIARSAAISPRFMEVLKHFDAFVVQAQAVATLAPGQSACNAAPIGVCADMTKPAPDYGHKPGDWIKSTFNNGAGPDDADVQGDFRWVDFTPSAGGTNEVRDQLLGNAAVCGIKVGGDVSEQGVKQGAKSAWNTRFGFYPNGANGYTPQSVAPDKTGYAFPSKAPGPVIPIGTSAYAAYRQKQAEHAVFVTNEYDGANKNIAGKGISSSDYQTYGAERRLVVAPILECGKSPSSVKILGMACVLMLNPMSNGSKGDLYLEWLGMANVPGSPCRTMGAAGGTTGALVPTLVQ